MEKDVKKKKLILVIGPPGVGKGTQSKILSSKLKYQHLSLGDIVRQQTTKNTELSKLIAPYANKGTMVPDNLIAKLLQETLNTSFNDGFVLDGYPRNANQALNLQSDKTFEIERVLVFEAPDEVCMTRLLNRNDPIRKNKDQDESYNSGRIKFFNEHYQEIYEIFKDKIQVIDADTEMEKVTENMEKTILMDPGKDLLTENQPVLVKTNSKIKKVYNEKAMEDDIKITTAFCEEHKNFDKDTKVNVGVTINVPDAASRVPVDVCCVIDISGSMTDDAIFQDPEDETKTKTDGMSILDLVKHAVKTVIHTLTDADRVSLVTFDDIGTIDFPLNFMNENNRKKALDVLSTFNPRNCTNIWAGLEAALKSFQNSDSNLVSKDENIRITSRRKFIFLLTDGQPNAGPPDGEVETLKKYLQQDPYHYFQIYSFGFGYNLNSKILHGIANVGGGGFGFIPDAKIVGTNFVNCIANACTTLAVHARLVLHPIGGSTIVSENAVKGLDENGKDCFIVNLGNLQFGQKRDACVTMKLGKDVLSGKEPNYLNVTLEYESFEEYISKDDLDNNDTTTLTITKKPSINPRIDMHKSKTKSKKTTSSTSSKKDKTDTSKIKQTKMHKIFSSVAFNNKNKTMDSVAAYARNLVVKETLSVINDYSAGNQEKAIKNLEKLSKEITTLDDEYENEDNRINGLVFDLIGFGGKGGRMAKAVTTSDRFRRWGENYLRSISRAHDLQLRTNFIDIGLQVYGGETFKILEEEGGKIFLDLPMVRTREIRDVNNNVVQYDNSAYYGGGGGGCFDGSCLVEVLDTSSNSTKKEEIRNIKKDDFLVVLNYSTLQTEFARVLCKIEISLDPLEQLVEFPSTGLKITKKHPILFENKWINPINLVSENNGTAKFVSLDNSVNKRLVVYNFILEKCHVLKVNDTFCVTFGHGIREAFHSFYGTNEVIEVVKKSRGFEKGFVSVEGNVRNLINMN